MDTGAIDIGVALDVAPATFTGSGGSPVDERGMTAGHSDRTHPDVGTPVDRDPRVVDIAADRLR